MPEVKRVSEPVNLDFIFKQVFELEKLENKIGWFESARYNEEVSVASVAAQNEYGNGDLGIPPRPFMRPAINEHGQQWQRLLLAGSKDIIFGRETALTVMDKMGQLIAGQIRQNISDMTAPKLKPRTVQDRLRARNKDHSKQQADAFLADNHTITKPLVFTGIMKNTVTYVVADGQEVQPWISEAVDKHNVYGDKT